MRIRQPLPAVLVALFCLIFHCSCAKHVERVEPRVEKIETFVFECPNKESYTVRSADNSASLFLPMGFVSLPRVQSTSGMKYSDGTTTVWLRGTQAILNVGGKPLGACINNPRSAAWEKARLDGVNFRAVGNHPGWYLEITDNRSIVVGMDKEKKRYEFPFVAPKLSAADAKAVYETKKDSWKLVVVTTGQECRDLATGKLYNRTVTLKLNSKSYAGCGKELD